MANRPRLQLLMFACGELQKLTHQWDVTRGNGRRGVESYLGATTQAYAIHPDVALGYGREFADLSEVNTKLTWAVITFRPRNHRLIRERCSKPVGLEFKIPEESDRAGGIGTMPTPLN